MGNVEPDLWERRVLKKKFRVKMDSFKSGGLNQDKNRLRVFTDGSKPEDGEAGFEVFFETPFSGEHAIGQTLSTPPPTVFQAEAIVITKTCDAVSMVLAEDGVLKAVTIYSDSQSVLQVRNSGWITSKAVWECASALTDLG